MLDVYVYYPRGPSLQPPRQVGQVQQPYRYADQGVQERDHTPGRDAVDVRVRDALQKPQQRRQEVPDRDAGAPRDDQDRTGGNDTPPGEHHIDTYA